MSDRAVHRCKLTCHDSALEDHWVANQSTLEMRRSQFLWHFWKLIHRSTSLLVLLKINDYFLAKFYRSTVLFLLFWCGLDVVRRWECLLHEWQIFYAFEAACLRWNFLLSFNCAHMIGIADLSNQVVSHWKVSLAVLSHECFILHIFDLSKIHHRLLEWDSA